VSGTRIGKIRRVLVANRGEIALRVIRACRELGLETVAVYSEADRHARHVDAADRAIPIGAPPAVESYLAIPKLLDAARAAGADAVHPGYGFLSENAQFAAACAERNLTFIGPPADAIEKMGSKTGARQLMQSAGVPVVPGLTPPDQDDQAVARAALEVGLPALIKASAGGGGKGMRIVRTASELGEAIASARREAMAAFGDGTLYVERLIERPRHVEFQVFADHAGHVVHLFERECSVQRRHQKIIEESPSPVLTPALRERMGDAAVAAARACGYRNAGTIEFLVDGEGRDARFYFLEMNTRLQVEHPVTEGVTGLDLVHLQLRVAAGEPLPFRQSDVTSRGHAIECRVYAEDPDAGFLPQAGRLLLYREPTLPAVRIDSGVAEGSEITVHYDPMIAKVIATATTRDAAIARIASALAQFPILGVRTNTPFLLRILAHPAFRAGKVHTAFLDETVLAPLDGRDDLRYVAAAAVANARQTSSAAVRAAAHAEPWTALTGWRG
jgi:acetyl-CoA carboxylase biotin carboxylase subunit